MNVLVRVIQYLRDNLWILRSLIYGVMILTFIADIRLDRHHSVFVTDNIPGFWSVFGFFGCLLLIRACKGLGHVWLMKDEDYYDK
ncbi:MAG: hypothetical protein V1736_02430 [Pseudomonadota bacterium]